MEYPRSPTKRHLNGEVIGWAVLTLALAYLLVAGMAGIVYG
jgi:hypothetical protein